MMTMHTADFDTYDAIEQFVYDWYLDEDSDLDRQAVIDYAKSLGVVLTDWDITSLIIDFEEI